MGDNGKRAMFNQIIRLRLTDDCFSRLRNIAKREKKTVSALARTAIDEYIYYDQWENKVKKYEENHHRSNECKLI